ncbi:MAG TPA: TolC family outer membrane protein [Phenylobacterium sp.]|uniref:TolC family outer membrane protein n=1 Tax=Phenylobacterium sp. TaxID=1871053 RepID=UPI002D4CBD86|nr:TolC family outer membrane protein [Phenylobacterium sp.]HZZ66829.1 TolC family outer membrane protein [Phenylobacterium sp.]
MNAEPRRWGRRGGVALLALACALSAAPAGATTLMDAIRLAYQTNPTLRAQRAELAAVGEGYVQARANLGPQVNLNGQGGYSIARVQAGPGLFTPPSDTTYRGTTGMGDFSIVQPIFTFGADKAQIRGAQADVLSGREDLRRVESETLQKVIVAYVDVRRDRQIMTILRDEIDHLTHEFEETQAKGELGQLTRTDVAEAQARLLAAESQLEAARGRLTSSNAAYLAVVGENPDELAPEPDLPGMPATIDQALAAAEHNNPQLRSAMEAEKAAREKVNAAKAAYGPTIGLRFDAGVSPVEPYIPGLYDRNITVEAVVSQPIFTSGMRGSKVREAADRDSEALIGIEAARRQAVQTIAQAWGAWTTARDSEALTARQVEAESVAVEGNEVEERVGRRSIFELVNIELDFANARVQLVESRHDEYAARAALLAAMGVLEARFLTPGVDIYDPTASLKKAQRGAVPWEGAIQTIDSAVGPHTPPPRAISPGAGSTHPILGDPTAAAAPISR